MAVALTILPVALAIVMGWAARATGLVRAELWPSIETFCFHLLFPVILIHAIAGADLSLGRVGAFSSVLVATCILAGGLVLVVGRRVRGPSLGTLFQTSVRYNGFVSLAGADLLLGAAGLSLVAVSMAVLIPAVNVASILVLSILCGGETGPRRIARTVLTNPMVIGSAIGVALNLAGGLPVWAAETLEIIGRAALGVGLLAVGAGIQVTRLVRVSLWVWAGLAMRPALVAGLFLALAWIVGLSTTERVAGILIFAVPAASNGYIVTKAMGGDADLYADLIAWQTLLSMLAIPVYAALIL